MALRPSISITSSAAAVSASGGEPLGVWMIAAQTVRGPAKPNPLAPIRSLSDFETTYGGRDATLGLCATTFDAVDAFFRSGGQAVYVSRVTGPASVVASKTLMDRAGTPVATLKVSAKGPGVWANTHLTVTVENGTTANTYIVKILLDGVVVESTPELAAPSDAVTWSANSAYVTITDLDSATAAPSNIPAVVAAQAFTGGVDDLAAVTDTQWTLALNDGFPAAYGPAMVSKVGVVTAAGHAGTVAHAAATNRMALLDGPKSASQSALTTLASTVQSSAPTSCEFAAMFAPWLVVPSAYSGTSNRIIAPSAIAAGLMSKQITVGNASVPAAGDQGKATYVVSTANVFTDAELDTMNGVSPVNIFRQPYPASVAPPIELYGYNTLANQLSGSTNSSWRQMTAQLVRLQLTHELRVMAERFIFDRLDGKRLKIAEFGAALSGILLDHFTAGDLYGDSPAEAFAVDVDSVNTEASIAAGKLCARVNLKISPFAEWVQIDIVKVAGTQPIAG